MNPASRIAEILRVAKEQKPNDTVSAAWANTFKIPKSADNLKKNMEVLTFISLLNDEFNLMEEQIKQDNSLEEQLIGPPLSVVKAVLGSVGSLESQWQPFRDQIQVNTLRELGWISHAFEKFENKEEEIAGEELNNLIKEISELEEIIEKSNLSPPVRQLILHHIEIIRRAIKHYPIIGASAFKDAVVNVCGEIIINGGFPGELNEKENINVRDRFKNILKRSLSNMEKAPQAYAAYKITEEVVSGFIKLIAP